MKAVLPNIEPRIYQQVIFSECVSTKRNTLVVLPTGLGKTIIMAYLTTYRMWCVQMPYPKKFVSCLQASSTILAISFIINKS